LDIEEISEFVAEHTCTKIDRISADTDIYKDLGIIGDDFSELLEDFASKYNVKMNKYLWYFHNCDEGWAPWSFIFNPPNAKVHRMPVTPSLLLELAEAGEWRVEYPEHDEPKDRRDITYGLLFYGFLFVVMFCIVVRYT